MEKEKVFQLFDPFEALGELPQKISNYLEKEYKPLALFCEKPLHAQGMQRVWETPVVATEEYDLDKRVQKKLRPGRIAILKNLRILKECFDEKYLMEIFEKKRDVQDISRLFTIVYNFFDKKKQTSVIEVEEALKSLSYYAEVLKTRNLVESTGTKIGVLKMEKH